LASGFDPGGAGRQVRGSFGARRSKPLAEGFILACVDSRFSGKSLGLRPPRVAVFIPSQLPAGFADRRRGDRDCGMVAEIGIVWPGRRWRQELPGSFGHSAARDLRHRAPASRPLPAFSRAREEPVIGWRRDLGQVPAQLRGRCRSTARSREQRAFSRCSYARGSAERPPPAGLGLGSGSDGGPRPAEVWGHHHWRWRDRSGVRGISRASTLDFQAGIFAAQ
jgi:hypothetical protein